MWVRREQPEDQAEVHAVQTEAFGKGLPGVVPAEATLVDALRESDSWIGELSYVALYGAGIAGHVVCSRATVDGQPVLSLGPLGVRPKFQRIGIGWALVHTVIGAADALGEPLIGLVGNPRYYERMGFQMGYRLGILPDNDEWVQHFQVRTLSAYDPTLRGEFEWAPAFDDI